ncbi:terpenoid synthase [Schizopora paradoxa]|uniref:(2E,6E)-farnesyl diphosphate synthase n=1 Tax=Schizopora paradoxa TaxID=27342 RepID=A0A0H2SST7_9AGAM|nr:terpenoid synthase [Schizopora paradoxa]
MPCCDWRGTSCNTPPPHATSKSGLRSTQLDNWIKGTTRPSSMQRWAAGAVHARSYSDPRPRLMTAGYKRNGSRYHGTTTEPKISSAKTGNLPGSPRKSSSQEHRSNPASDIDPYALVSSDLEHVRASLKNLLGSSSPVLTSVASYYFKHPSKQLRPLLVLLFAKATNGLGGRWETKRSEARTDLDWTLSRPDILTDWNPSLPEHTSSFDAAFESTLSPPSHRPSRISSQSPLSSSHPQAIHAHTILPTQFRLAQIVEMIHVASLLHDDVIDASEIRRNVASAPAAFGSKMSILTGDFMLGRANAALSRLGDSEASELISCVVANLVEGEVLQMKQTISAELGLVDDTKEIKFGGAEGKSKKSRVSQDVWNVYLKKTFLKTASLMAKGARASVVLGGAQEGEVWKEVAYAYGRNLGIAFQLVDDILDYEAAEGTLGKPGGADLNLGLATGPALFAWEEHPAMGPLIERKFEQKGDVELARDLVRRSSGVERTRELAFAHADKALEVLQLLPASDARRALEVLCERVVKRTW